MAIKQFIDLQNLDLYDSLLKNYIAAEDAKSIKTVLIDGYTMKFYDVEEPVGSTTPKYNITLPEPDLRNFVEKVIEGSNGRALIWNEGDGGCLKFEHKDGTYSAVAVNDGGAGGLAAQIYAVNKDTKQGARLNVATTGIYYTNGKTNYSFTADDEVVTKKDLSDTGAGKTVYLIDESAGQSEYAKVYALYQGADAQDMTKNRLVGKINEAKDKVVQDGHLVTVTNGVDSDGDTVPAGILDGEYIKLTFQNTAQVVYINVADLIDLYTGGVTSEITVSIDANNVITASINDGSITKAKLSASVQASLDLADSSLQDEDIAPVDSADIEALFPVI